MNEVKKNGKENCMFIWNLYELIKFSSFFIRIKFNKIQPLIAKFDQTLFIVNYSYFWEYSLC